MATYQICHFFPQFPSVPLNFGHWIPRLLIFNYIYYLGLGDVDPIVSIFGVCDAEADDKLSMKEIQGKTDCWNMLDSKHQHNR